MILEIKDLSCGYDSEVILRNINVEVKENEFVGIIGPNGSGKTTFLRAVTRVVIPKKGIILLEGKDIKQIRYKELARKIAVVSQGVEAGLMSVEEFVLLGRISYYEQFQFTETKKDLEIAAESMRLTDTFRLKNRSMQELSAGERQLSLVARALAQEPKLLLLDEPTSHLDISHQVRILDLVKKLNKNNGLTVIVVMHDLNLASEYCDKLVLFNNGLIHKIGSPQEVLTYQIIEKVYKTVVVVERNPISFKPYILVVSEEAKQKRGAR